VDPRRLAQCVRVDCAGDYTDVSGAAVMQLKEIASVQRKERPATVIGELENPVVRDALVCLFSVERREDVVSQITELSYRREREVLICIEPQGQLSC